MIFATSLQVSIGITAAPRVVNYLPQTLTSLLSQTDGVQIFAEPGTELPDEESGCRNHQRSERLGNWHNWREMCKWLLANTSTPYILTAEDDVLFSKNAVADALGFAKTRTGEFGFVSLYTSAKYSRQTSDRPALGFRPLRIGRLWGACAWLFPRAALSAILKHLLAVNWPGTTPGVELPDGVDIVVGKILNDLRLPTYFATPSLVQHIGEHSAVGNGQGLTRGRTACDFVGVNSLEGSR